jgi:hypothetical protein
MNLYSYLKEAEEMIESAYIDKVNIEISRADGPAEEITTDLSKTKIKKSELEETVRETVVSFFENNSDENNAGKIPVLIKISFLYNKTNYDLSVVSKNKNECKVVAFDIDNKPAMDKVVKIKDFDTFYNFLKEEAWLTN